MSLVVTISGSPKAPSRTSRLNDRVAGLLRAQGVDVASIEVRDLPAEDLIYARSESPALREPLALLQQAQGVVISTPVYKASYTGVLKSFLDLLPQFGLAGKVVLPLATGGTLAHVLAIDYALRPVLGSLGARHVVGGLFILDKLISQNVDGTITLDPEIESRFHGAVKEFADSLQRHSLAA